MVNSKSGPKPEKVKITGDWESAVATALQKKRPAEGWPKAESAPKPHKPKKMRRKPA
jgi:hypothetical protein